MDLRSNCVQNAPPGGRPRSTNVENLGRSGRIRTCDPCVPNAVLYRAEPHSDKNAAYSLGFRTPQEAEFKDLNPSECGPENADSAGKRGRGRRSRTLSRGRWPGRVPDRDCL